MFNRPNRLTEPSVRYTSIFHIARLQTSPIRVKDHRPLPSANTIPDNTIDYEMNNITPAVNNNKLPTQSAPPTTTPATKPTAPLRSTKPPSEPMTSRLAGSSIPSDAGPNDRTLACICLTCERAATEAKHTAALRSQWARARDHGAKGYGYRHR
ncbi:MAG: hypothetical protein Q9161_007250 [Pseudevernia consocians]